MAATRHNTKINIDPGGVYLLSKPARHEPVAARQKKPPFKAPENITGHRTNSCWGCILFPFSFLSAAGALPVVLQLAMVVDCIRRSLTAQAIIFYPAMKNQ